MDKMLHAARIHRGAKVTFDADTSDLPEGTMVAVGERAFLKHNGVWHWSFEGYSRADLLPERVTVLTPQPVLPILAAGYVPQSCIPA